MCREKKAQIFRRRREVARRTCRNRKKAKKSRELQIIKLG